MSGFSYQKMSGGGDANDVARTLPHLGRCIVKRTAVAILALVASILRLALRRTAWWIPPVALVVAIVAQQVGGSIADGW